MELTLVSQKLKLEVQCLSCAHPDEDLGYQWRLFQLLADGSHVEVADLETFSVTGIPSLKDRMDVRAVNCTEPADSDHLFTCFPLPADINSRFLSLDKDVLTPGQRYRVQCESGGAFAAYDLQTNRLPTGGSCHANETSGTYITLPL